MHNGARFDPDRTLEVMESLKLPNGAFVASSSEDYRATWLRDHLYMTYAYYYLGQYEELVEGIHVAFNVLHNQRYKLDRISQPRDPVSGLFLQNELIHTKYDAATLSESNGSPWGHHQVDALGLFLHVVADLDFKNIKVCRDRGDQEILQLLALYLERVRYWDDPDMGMWEECLIRHASSIGAAHGGLSYLHRRYLAVVPMELMTLGRNALVRILPYESRDQCRHSRYGLRHSVEVSHDCDVAQLFLIWPFNVVTREMADTILSRILGGHTVENGMWHKLVRDDGIQRYWGDSFYESHTGSAAWQWDFLVSIIHSQRREYDWARYWFERGASRITPEGSIAEAYCNGTANPHTPLGWMHALALIAYSKLLPETQRALRKT